MLLVQQHEFPRLARVMGHPELVTDPRFSSNGRRVRNNAVLKEMIENWLASFPDRDAAVAALDKERVPCGPVLALEEAVNHPHLRERKTVRKVSDPRLGEFNLPAMPVNLCTVAASSSFSGVVRAAPGQGKTLKRVPELA